MNFFQLPIGAGPNDPVVGEVDGAQIRRAPNGTKYYSQYRAPAAPAAPSMMTETTLDEQGRAIHNRVQNTTRDQVRAILAGPEAIAGEAVRGLTAPGRALRGEPVTYGDAWATALDYGVGSAPTSAPEGSLRIFAGRNAKTADLSALARAERMASDGAANDEIWRNTGWFRGADDKWRFEIDDSLAALRDGLGDMPVRMDTALDHPALFEAYPELGDMSVSRRNIDARGQFEIAPGGDVSQSSIALNRGLDDVQARSTMLHEGQHAVQNLEGFDAGSNPQFSSNQAGNFAVALRNSPEARAAKDASYAYDSLREEASPIWRAQTLNRYDRLIERGHQGSLKPRDIERQADFYEVGREIRDALGPMPKRPGPQRDEWLTAAAVRMKANYLNELGATDAANARYVLEDYPTPREVNNAARRVERKMDKVMPGARQWMETKERAADFASLDPMDSYFRNSGEVEARNVQSRRDMTPTERLETPPWKTMTAPERGARYSDVVVSIPFENQVVSSVKPGQSLPSWFARLYK